MCLLSTRSIATLVLLLQSVFTAKEIIASPQPNDVRSITLDFQRKVNKAVNATSMNMTLDEENRVFHGSKVTHINRAPFMVSLRILTKIDQYNNLIWRMCGAVLIAPKYLLTAAHCMILKGEQENTLSHTKYIRARVHSLQYSSSRSSGQVIEVTKMYIPKKYKYRTNKIWDIAVLELSKEVAEEYRHFATLAHPDEDTHDMAGEIAQVFGWGLTSEAGKPSNDLLTGTVSILTTEECKSEMGLPTRNEALQKGTGFWMSNSHICYTGTYQKSCQGDSGGPILFNNKVFGIMSRGIAYCNPYTVDSAVRVTAVWDFINRYAHLGLERDEDSSRWDVDVDVAPDSAGEAYMKTLHLLAAP